jgi:hypothetical protein
MTRDEWFACADPKVLGERVWHLWTQRRRRLYLCACCRLLWPWLTKEPVRRLVEAAERLADGEEDAEVIAVGLAVARKARSQAPLGTPWEHSLHLAMAAGRGAMPTEWEYNGAATRLAQAFPDGAARACGLVRDLHNPFGPEVVEWEWVRGNGGAAAQLARGVYDRRSFDELPMLADVLEEAGCRDPEVLRHCRTPGEHFRGCWVLDLLLLQG